MSRCGSSNPAPPPGGLPSHRLDAFSSSSLRWATVKLTTASPSVAAAVPLAIVALKCAILFKRAGGMLSSRAEGASLTAAVHNRRRGELRDGSKCMQRADPEWGFQQREGIMHQSHIRAQSSIISPSVTDESIDA